MAALIMGLSTLVGFETAANMAEEAKDPFRTVPRAIVGSVSVAAVFGFLLVIVLTVSITDMTRVSTSASPVAEIMAERFGPGLERPLLAAIAMAFFGAALIGMVSTARYIFSMSRDRRFPGHQVMRRVNPRTKTPIPATLLVLIVGVLLMIALPGAALLQLILTGAFFTVVPYIMTIVLYISVRRKLGRGHGAFDLGRAEWPVAIGALVWLLVALFVVIATSTLVPMLIVAGLLILGLGYFGYMWKFDREVLEIEPGGSDMVTTVAK
jgi:amino acid transporter